jgi:hypothetical protein
MIYMNARETLELMLGVPQETIDDQLSRAAERFDAIGAALCEFVKLEPREQTPDRAGVFVHLSLLYGKALSERAGMHPDIGFFKSYHVASELAEDVVMGGAYLDGTLGKLNSEMEAIREAAGYGRDDPWTTPSGDYLAAQARFDAEFQRIHKTVTLEILRRYRCSGIIALMDDDPVLFAVRVAVGLRLCSDPRRRRSESEDADFEEQHGAAAAEMLKQRLRQAGREA